MSSAADEVVVDPRLFPEGGPSEVTHCVVHGEPAARTVDMAVQSRTTATTPLWQRVNVLSLLSASGEWSEKVRVVKVYGWPLCAQCARERALRFGVFVVVLASTVALLVIGAVLRLTLGTVPVPGVFAFGVLVGLLLAPLVFAWAGLRRWTRARASDDGGVVLVEAPAEGFRRDLDAARA